MARLSRIVIPGAPHHVTQRGNRLEPVFFSDDDRLLYLDLLRQGCAAAHVECLAWCLMTNHVHLILIPGTEDGLRAALAETHRRYSRHINAREGWTGYLFQGRFASYPMDDAHLMAAVRYVELNPVAAGLVVHAQDWRWSSARSHVSGRRMAGDPLTNVAALGVHVRNWHAVLRHGLEAGDLGAEGQAVADEIERKLRTGRPLATEDWIAQQEATLARKLAPARRGPKPKA
jgi:putative transposase